MKPQCSPKTTSCVFTHLVIEAATSVAHTIYHFLMLVILKEIRVLFCLYLQS